MLAALDLGSGQMFYRIRDRKRWREFLALLKLLRAQRHRSPHTRLARRDDRPIHALAQRPRPAQDQLRRQVSHPHLDQLPDQRCMTRH